MAHLNRIFVILIFALVFFRTPVCEAQRVFWSENNNNRIMVGNLSPTGITSQVPYITGLNGPRDISLDPGKNYFFYTEEGGEALVRRSYSGATPLVLRDYQAFTGFNDIAYSQNAAGVFGVHVSDEDHASFTDESGNPTFYLPLGAHGGDEYIGVAVSDGNELVYLINQDDDRVYETDFSGTTATAINVGVTGLDKIAVDDVNGKLFYTAISGFNYILYSCNFNGAGVLTIGNLGSSQVTSIYVYPQFNKVYYVAGDAIWSINADGSGSNTMLMSLPGTGISDIAIEADVTPPVFITLVPTDNNLSVNPATTQLQMTFDEAVKIATGTFATGADLITIQEEGVTVGTLPRSSSNISISGNTVTITLPIALSQARNYNILVGNSVFADLSGNKFIGIVNATGWNFTTQCTSLTAGTAQGTQSVCVGGDPSILRGGVATGGNGTYAYQWESSIVSASTGFSPITGEEGADYDPPANIAVTTYYRRVTSSGNCTPAANNPVITVTVVAPPIITAQPTPQEACDHSTATFSITATAGGTLTYQWQSDTGSGYNDLVNNAQYSGVTTNQLSISNVNGLNGSRYQCVVGVSGACPTISNAVALTVHPLPVVVDQTVPPLCESSAGSGSASFNLTTLEPAIINGQSNLSVSWYNDSNLASPVSTPTNASVTNGYVMYANVKHAITGCFMVAKASFTINSLPVANATPSNQTICSGGNTSIALNGSYSWSVSSNPNITGSTSGTGSSINQLLNNISSSQQQIIYTVTPSSNGCNGSPITIPITVDPLPAAFNVSGGGTHCVGGPGVQISLSNSQAGVTYTLYANNQVSNNTASPGGGAFSFAPVTSAGNYTVTATNGASCSNVMNGSAQVLVNEAPSGGTISGNTAVCGGRMESYTVSNLTNALTYTWSVPSGMVIIDDPDTDATINVQMSSITAGDNISVTGTNTCGTSTRVVLPLQALPSPSVEIILPESAFAEEPVAFSYTTSATIASQQWNFGDNSTSTFQSPEHTYALGGNYNVSVEVTDNAGCKGSDTKLFTVKPKLGLSDFSIKNVVTANGDNKNAFLFIQDLEKFPNNEVVLLDRWGMEVFRTKGYNNEWDLKRNGDYLPAGNYICIVKLEDTGEIYKRSITVIKGK